MEVILYLLVALVVAVAVGAGIIMLATKLVGGFTPSFGSCVLAALAAWIGSAIVNYVLSMVLGAGGLTALLSLVVVFLLYAFIINALVKPAGGGQMGFGKAALVTLVVIIIYIVIGVLLFFTVGAAIMGLMSGVH